MIAGGIDWDLLFSRIARWVAAATGLPVSKILWSQNKAPRPAADGIVMRIMGVETVGDSWADIAENPLVFDDLVVESVSAAANTVTVTAHDLTTGDGPVRIDSTGTMPGGLLPDTDYWVVVPNANTLKFAETFAQTGGTDIDGAPSGNTVTTIDITSVGTGVITISSTADTLRAGEEILQVARGVMKLTLDLECHTTDSVGLNMAVAVLHRVAARSTLPSQVALLAEAGIGVQEMGKVRAVRGHLDALLFEPRAMLEVTLAVASEDSESGTIIRSADLTPTYDDVVGSTIRVPVGSG